MFASAFNDVRVVIFNPKTWIFHHRSHFKLAKIESTHESHDLINAFRTHKMIFPVLRDLSTFPALVALKCRQNFLARLPEIKFMLIAHNFSGLILMALKRFRWNLFRKNSNVLSWPSDIKLRWRAGAKNSFSDNKSPFAFLCSSFIRQNFLTSSS